MPQAPDLAYAIGLPPADAIDYFKSRGYQVSANALDAWQAAQDRAFTVTGITRLDVLQDIKGALDKQLAGGGTLAMFKNDLQKTLAARGWTRVGQGLHADAQTAEVAADLPASRLQTIFRTNMQSALMAGKYKQLREQVDLAPYWQYVAVMDNRTRPTHAAANGKTFRADDPFWDTHYPPCGYNCRCGVRSLSDAMVKARGLDVMDGADYLEPTEVNVGGTTRPATAFVDPTTKVRFVPDPGFGAPPKSQDWGALGQALSNRIESAPPDAVARVMAATPRLQEPLAAEYQSWAQSVLDAGRATNDYRVVGTASPAVVKFIDAQGDQAPLYSAAVSLRDTELLHMARDAKRRRGAALSAEDLLNLPALLANARATLWDTEDPALIYVLNVASSSAQKVVVRVNWTMRVHGAQGRQAMLANAVRTAGKVQVGDLKADRYKLIEGDLEK